MDADEHKSEEYLKDETYQIIGFAMKLLNHVGHGFHEKIYENDEEKSRKYLKF